MDIQAENVTVHSRHTYQSFVQSPRLKYQKCFLSFHKFFVFFVFNSFLSGLPKFATIAPKSSANNAVEPTFPSKSFFGTFKHVFDEDKILRNNLTILKSKEIKFKKINWENKEMFYIYLILE